MQHFPSLLICFKRKSNHDVLVLCCLLFFYELLGSEGDPCPLKQHKELNFQPHTDHLKDKYLKVGHGKPRLLSLVTGRASHPADSLADRLTMLCF